MINCPRNLPIYVHATCGQQVADVLATEAGQVGEEAIEAHQCSGASSPLAQRAQMQALLRAASGMLSRSSAGMRVEKHQQGWAAPGSHWAH